MGCTGGLGKDGATVEDRRAPAAPPSYAQEQYLCVGAGSRNGIGMQHGSSVPASPSAHMQVAVAAGAARAWLPRA